jgi:Domain of unknown function (DUF4062)
MPIMPDLKVFISSTYEDLKPYREKVIDFFKEGIPDILFKGMEAMPASDTRPMDECRQKVQQSNVVILIIGKRYGWIPGDAVQNPNQLSITELEYNWAKEHFRNREDCILLCFVADKTTELPGDSDTDPEAKAAKARKLNDFIGKVRSEAGIVPTKGFITVDDLVKQINKALWNRFTTRHNEKQVDKEAIYCCNRDDNYRIFKTTPRRNDNFNLFLAIGTREDVLENFFHRIIIFDYQGTADKLKALPQKPLAIDADKCLREHIEKIAFEIDPLRSTTSITEAIANYNRSFSSNIYFKSDVSAMDITELEDYIRYLQLLFAGIEQQAATGNGVKLFIFIYTNYEELHSQLTGNGCVKLGEFNHIGLQDIKNWLGNIISRDSGVQDDIIDNCILEPGGNFNTFQYTMKQTEKKLRVLIKRYNDKDEAIMQLIN